MSDNRSERLLRSREVGRECASEMRELYESGWSTTAIGRRYDIGAGAVSAAIRRAGGVVRTRGENNTRSRVKTRESAPEMRRRYESGETLQQVADDYELSVSAVRDAIVREGGTIRKRGFGSAPERFTGSNNPAWRGGRHVNRDGYVMVYLPDDHPFASMRRGKGPHVLEHRLVAATMLGRALDPTETVHHIDGNRTNNDPANLQVRTGRHGTGVHLRCADCGSQNITATQL